MLLLRMGERKPELRAVASDLNSAAIHLLRGLRHADRQSGLTPARLSALSVLVFGGPVALGRLARMEGVASPTMTRIVDGLERLGLAARTDHPDSSRVVLVTATETGRQLMSAAAERRLDLIVAALVRLADTDLAAVQAAAPALRELARLVVSRTPQPA
jgi:DNA-binding MarR family transcriptional regulator